MKKIVFLLMLLGSINSFAQGITFKGIPLGLSEKSTKTKMLQKGFVYDRQTDFYLGTFASKQVKVKLETGKGIVPIIRVLYTITDDLDVAKKDLEEMRRKFWEKRDKYREYTSYLKSKYGQYDFYYKNSKDNVVLEIYKAGGDTYVFEIQYISHEALHYAATEEDL